MPHRSDLDRQERTEQAPEGARSAPEHQRAPRLVWGEIRPPCRVPECAEFPGPKGLCHRHADKARRLGFNPRSLTAAQLAQLRVKPARLYDASSRCTIPGCPARPIAKGLCVNDYVLAKHRGFRPGALDEEAVAELARIARQRHAPRRDCGVPACKGPAGLTGLCQRHYRLAWGRGLDPARLSREELAGLEVRLPPGRRPTVRPCTVPGCERPAAIKGLCQKDYVKARSRGFAPGALTEAELKQLAVDLRKARRAAQAPAPRRTAPARCSEPGCERRGFARGLCTRHYLMRTR